VDDHYIFFEMHEMSLAVNIIKIAQEELTKANGKRIEKIHLSVGKLSGIVIESLEFALEVSQKDGPLAGAQIIIEEVPAVMKCRHCHHQFEAKEFYTVCPICNKFGHDIISGKELLIKSLTII
jgi:hydrogenase nickel incorporation protein HypA/HybF